MTLPELKCAPLSSDPILDWIDREIRDLYALRFEKESTSDVLLELRHHYQKTSDTSLNALVSGFYRLLPKIEAQHYLISFRIRQWFSLTYQIELSDPLNRTLPVVKPLCQTVKSLEGERKAYFEAQDYALPYHDIRLTVCKKN